MKKISPRKANTEEKILMLSRDNKQFGSFDIMVDTADVTIYPDSSNFRQWFNIPKKDFNRMIDWYNREQKIKP